MGFSSQGGALILRSQAAQGTFQADISTTGVGALLRSGGLGSSRELMMPDPEIGGGRDVVDSYLGAVSWSGDYEFYARTDMLATILKAALGTSATSTTTGVSTHTITPSDAAQLPYLSAQERVGAGLEYFNYTDMVVNTFHLESDANGYLMGTAGVIAARQAAGSSALTPTFDATPMFVGTNIAITYNGVSLPAKSFSLDINNNFEDDDYRLGSFYIGDLTPKRREVTASFSIRESASALWRQATYGVSSATTPGGLTTKQSLVITATTYETISGGTPATSYQVQFTFPNFALSPYSLEQSGDDVIESDIEGRALRPAIGTSIVTAVLKTGKATIA